MHMSRMACGHMGEEEGGAKWESSSDMHPRPRVKGLAGGKPPYRQGAQGRAL